MVVVINKHIEGTDDQMSKIGRHSWSVSRLIELSKDLKVMEVPIEHMNIYHSFGVLSLRELVGHMKSVLDADLRYPIILDEDGEIMDGRHRLMKALLQGHETIMAVRFEKNPKPCSIIDDDS